jgi:hypothetical protein
MQAPHHDSLMVFVGDRTDRINIDDDDNNHDDDDIDDNT